MFRLLEIKEMSIEYLLSKHILKNLLNTGLINEDEFNKIDEENLKTFNNKSIAWA